MNTPANLKYTKSDEWFDPASGKIGLTDFAQGQLSDIVFLEVLVSVGDTIQAGTQIASVESVKAVSEIFMPVAGEIVEVNNGLNDAPENVNNEPYTSGWMVKVKMDNPLEADAMLSSIEYEEYLAASA